MRKELLLFIFAATFWSAIVYVTVRVARFAWTGG